MEDKNYYITSGYLNDSPKFDSAFTFATTEQIIAFLSLIAFCMMLPFSYICCIFNLIYFVLISTRLYCISLTPKYKGCTTKIDTKSLPIYTVMCALYKESSIVMKLIRNLQKLDYPKDLLQVLIILEEDDKETLHAITHLPENFQVLIAPKSDIKTKPNALNYGLSFVKSDLIVVYDAEDIPDSDQLIKAARVFDANKDIACVQARLVIHNHSDSFLARMFSYEYSMLFQRILPALEELNLPIPLGGTSNHIRTSILRSFGGWDRYNVTEDADLGMKLARSKLKTVCLDSDTLEECPNTLISWINQRTRWIKGFIQTYFVHMRNPINLTKEVGVFGVLAFHVIFKLSNVVFLMGPIIWIYGLFTIKSNMIYVYWLNLIYGYFSLIYGVYVCNNSQKRTLITSLAFPLYFFLHSIAVCKAVFQIFTKLHFWNKTEHGKCLNNKNDQT